MTALPAAYAWLVPLMAKPRMIVEALALYGTHETPGATDNPVIMAWAKEVGVAYTSDSETPWCGLFMAVVAKRAGKAVVDSPLWALNWAKFGAPSPEPSLGDVLVFKRHPTPQTVAGHVGLYVADDVTHFHVLGGNTADSVSITRIAKDRLVACRRPIWTTAQPYGVRPHRVAATGAVSTNEA